MSAVASMTGFARVSGELAAWEVKSVNGRGLDVRLRLPAGLDTLEPKVREAVARVAQRGSVTVGLELTRLPGPALSISQAMIERILALQAELGPRIDQSPPKLTELLQIRGVLEAGSEVVAPPEPDLLLALLDQALDAFAVMRRAEGARLKSVLDGHLDQISQLTAEAGTAAALQPAAIAERLRRQLAQLLDPGTGPAPDRLAAEVALLAGRADATEELNRLAAHVAAARELLAGGGAIGRRLDFLAQEFHREANTLGSKAAELGVTRASLALKTAIEQFREQVQNVE